MANIRFQSELVSVSRDLHAQKTNNNNTDRQHAKVNTEAADVSVYSSIYKVKVDMR